MVATEAELVLMEHEKIDLARLALRHEERIAALEAAAENALRWFEQVDHGRQDARYFEAFDRLRAAVGWLGPRSVSAMRK